VTDPDATAASFTPRYTPKGFPTIGCLGEYRPTTLYQTRDVRLDERDLLSRVAVYARNSAAWSVAHSRKVRGGAPVSSANVDVTNAG
jgi:hypothetical protein